MDRRATAATPGHAAEQEKIRNWLYYREHSGDIIVEQNCHNLDVVNWFMGTHPVKASGYGGRAVRKSPGNIMDNLGVTFEFADGAVFSYSASQFRAGYIRTSQRCSLARRPQSAPPPRI